MTSPLTSSFTYPMTYSLTKSLGTAMGNGGVNTTGVFNYPAFERMVFQGDAMLDSGSNLGIVADGPKLALSFMVQPPPSFVSSSDGILMTLLANTSGCVNIARNAANQIRILVKDPTTALTLQAITTTTFKAGDPPSHIAMYVETNHAAGSKIAVIMVNGVQETLSTLTDASATFSINVTDTHWFIGAVNTALGSPMTQGFEFGPVMLWAGTTIDWTDPVQMAKAYANGAFVDPGTDGSLVTGVAPPLYLAIKSREAASTFLTNRGSDSAHTWTIGNTGGAAAGNPMKNQRALLEEGTSRTAGTGSSSPSKSVARLVARGFPTPRYNINRGQGGWNLGVGQSVTGIANQMDSDFASLCARFSDRMWRTEGSINGIHSPNVVIEVAAGKQIRNRVRQHDSSTVHYHVGILHGGQAEDVANTGVPNASYLADDEEFGAVGHLYDSTSASNGVQYNNIEKINQPLIAYMGADFFDLNRAHITGFSSSSGPFQAGGADHDPADATADALDGRPIGILALLTDLAVTNPPAGTAFSVATYGSAGTDQDSYNITHGARPTSLMSLDTTTNVTNRTTRRYGTHSNDFGHYVEAILELRFLKWRNYLSI